MALKGLNYMMDQKFIGFLNNYSCPTNQKKNIETKRKKLKGNEIGESRICFPR